MNVSATLNAFRVLRSPSLCLPHATVSTFNHLPVPLSQAFTATNGGQEPDIRAVVLDKDNCFAIPKENKVYKPYEVGFVSISKASCLCFCNFQLEPCVILHVCEITHSLNAYLLLFSF